MVNNEVGGWSTCTSIELIESSDRLDGNEHNDGNGGGKVSPLAPVFDPPLEPFFNPPSLLLADL